MLNQVDLHQQLLKTLGPLAPLYTDPIATKIYVDSYQRINVDRTMSMVDLTRLTFDSPQALEKMIADILVLYGVEPKPGQTVIDLRLEKHARMQIVLPPTALQGPHVVIHKLPEAHLSWEKLIEMRVINRPMVDALQEMIYQKQNLLVIGEANSNRLATAALLAERIPMGDRVAVVEREHEMQINHPNAIFLEASQTSYTELIQIAARMAPRWLVLSELIGPETMTVMDLFSRGFCGVTTLYANGIEDALKRLEMMCLMANPGLGLEQIRVLIASALQVIIHHQQVGNLDSKIIQIVELVGVDEGHYLLQPLFIYNVQKNSFEPTGVEPTWRQKD